MAQSKVPKFGSWENGEVAYTAYFEVARKGNTGGPIINPNDIQMNRDVPRAAPNHTKPAPKPQQQQQQQQAKFGAWNDGEDVPYTQIFENKGRTTNPNEPQMNRDVGPTQQHPKQQQQQHQPPKFGAWEGADEVPYTQIFENKANPNPNPNPNPKEPQMNRDVGHTRQPQEPQPKPQGVKFLDNKPKQQQPPAPRPQNGGGRGGASIPVFGGWNNDPTQAGGYTVVFEKLHEDKKNVNVPNVPNLPTHNNNNNRHNPAAHSNNNRRTPTRPIKQQQKQGGCFSWLLG